MSDIPFNPPAKEQPRSPWPRFLLYSFVGFIVLTLLTIVPILLLPEESTALILALGVAAFLTHVFMLYTFALRPGWLTLDTLGLRPFRWEWRWLWIGVGVSVLFLPFRALLGIAFEWLINGNLDSVNARSELFMSGGATVGGFIMAFIGIAILIPIGEELFFRGVLHSWLQKYEVGFWLRVVASSVIFALFHIDSLGVVASSFVLGLITAVAYERTKSLTTSIIIHMTTNGAAVLMMYGAIWLADYLPQMS